MCARTRSATGGCARARISTQNANRLNCVCMFNPISRAAKNGWMIVWHFCHSKARARNFEVRPNSEHRTGRICWCLCHLIFVKKRMYEWLAQIKSADASPRHSTSRNNQPDTRMRDNNKIQFTKTETKQNYRNRKILMHFSAPTSHLSTSSKS